MTTTDLLGLFAKIINGSSAEPTDWLALADAYEESGDTEMAGKIRQGFDEEKRESALRHWRLLILRDQDSMQDAVGSLVNKLLDRDPLAVVEYAERERTDILEWAKECDWDWTRVSMYDEEGVEGFRWDGPDGEEVYSCAVDGDWKNGPEIPDEVRRAVAVV